MTRALVVLLLVLLGLCGCGHTASVTGVVDVIEVRPEVIHYVDEWGRQAVASVWGHGPVNVMATVQANMGGQPRRANTTLPPVERVTVGASFLGTFDHTPVVGDSIVCDLLPYAPVVDSVGATTGTATLRCVLPDSLDMEVVVLVPPGTPYGPDTLRTYSRLVREP